MSEIIPNNEERDVVNLEVLINEEKKEVYVRFSGFESVADADEYADYLAENLPLILFESEVKH